MMAQISRNMKESKDKQAESSAPHIRSGDFGSNRIGTPQVNQARDDNRNHTKIPKIDFPYFSGECPREWGKADIWFHGFAASHPDAEWNLFAEEICRRFFDTTGEEVVETLSKIRQFGSITEYQENF
ncbi:Uncharacterized protein Adt_22914 [Abeliophyllum distichum]|uniref:Retrotransposon gag domain-containing protein n=1 Tax=Abeliophyllum distichum TaxID=126358 RepID=A0ABD1SCW3_9LAMI